MFALLKIYQGGESAGFNHVWKEDARYMDFFEILILTMQYNYVNKLIIQ